MPAHPTWSPSVGTRRQLGKSEMAAANRSPSRGFAPSIALDASRICSYNVHVGGGPHSTGSMFEIVDQTKPNACRKRACLQVLVLVLVRPSPRVPASLTQNTIALNFEFSCWTLPCESPRQPVPCRTGGCHSRTDSRSSGKPAGHGVHRSFFALGEIESSRARGCVTLFCWGRRIPNPPLQSRSRPRRRAQSPLDTCPPYDFGRRVGFILHF